MISALILEQTSIRYTSRTSAIIAAKIRYRMYVAVEVLRCNAPQNKVVDLLIIGLRGTATFVHFRCLISLHDFYSFRYSRMTSEILDCCQNLSIRNPHDSGLSIPDACKERRNVVQPATRTIHPRT